MLTDAERETLAAAQLAWRTGRLGEAEQAFVTLVQQRPTFVFPRRRLIHLLERAGRFEEALAHQRELYALCPEPETEFELATGLLGGGLYEEGWKRFESRLLLGNGASRVPLATPQWRGEPIERLLVWDEQGAGDTLQFCRFLLDLRAKGIEATFISKAPLGDLLDHNEVANILPARGAVQLPPHDAWVMLGSLPGLLGVTLETLPGRTSYIKAREVKAVGARIGVVGRGNPRHANDAHRSLPPAYEQKLRSIPGALSLHPGEALALADYTETAAVIAGLDLVITVDTSVAHLAGAMGAPCWVLLTAMQTDWRWLKTRPDSPWYPSLRLFRQPKPGDWASVFAELREALTSL